MGLPLPVAMLIWIAIGAAILAVVVFGFKRRKHDGEGEVTALRPIPNTVELRDPLTSRFSTTYVSTTRSGDWLARIGAFGLGNRSAAAVQVWETGVVVERRGERGFFIPVKALLRVGTSTGMAGKYVASEGLDVITWNVPGGLLVDTGFRLEQKADREELRSAITSILIPRIESTTPKESA